MRTDFHLGDWVVRPRRDGIQRGDEFIHVHPKPMAVLECLAAAGGEVVTREELFRAVWPGLIVTDDALTQCIVELRKAFRDSAHDPEIIETVPKVGFRLIPEVREVTADRGVPAGRVWYVAAAISLVILATASYYAWVLHDRDAVVTVVSATAQPSVAVLPFSNWSAGPEDAFFADGIHGELVSQVARIGSVKTISSTSVMRYRDTDRPIPEIARELGVTTVIEGGVQRAGDQVRINVQMIDALTDRHLWSETYDRQLTATNIFAIQSEIAEAVAEALQTTLSPEEKSRIQAIPTQSLEAYESYLIAKQRMARVTRADLIEAAGYFRQAIELDPRFAPAWAGLAEALLLQHRWYDHQMWMDEMRSETERAISMALDLDGSLGEAHVSLGLFRRYALRDFAGAENAYRRARELSPNHASAHLWSGHLLLETGRLQEAERMFEVALMLDPMSAIIRRGYALPLRHTGRFDEAMKELQRVIEIDPSFAIAHNNIGTMQQWAYGRYDEAARSLARSLALEPDLYDTYLMFGHLFRDLGDLDRADHCYQQAISHKLTQFGLRGRLRTALIRGDRDLASTLAGKLLERAERDHVALAHVRDQAMAAGQHQAALALYEEAYPLLFEKQLPDISGKNLGAVMDLVPVLRATGSADRADALLERALSHVRTRPRLGVWCGTLVADVKILTLQGRYADALAALREAVDDGWRVLWNYHLLYEPALEPIRAHPEFRAVVDEIAADMALQLERVREMEREGELAAMPVLARSGSALMRPDS